MTVLHWTDGSSSVLFSEHPLTLSFVGGPGFAATPASGLVECARPPWGHPTCRWAIGWRLSNARSHDSGITARLMPSAPDPTHALHAYTWVALQRKSWFTSQIRVGSLTLQEVYNRVACRLLAEIREGQEPVPCNYLPGRPPALTVEWSDSERLGLEFFIALIPPNASSVLWSCTSGRSRAI